MARFIGLSSLERSLFVRALGMSILVSALIKARGLRGTQRILDRVCSRPDSHAENSRTRVLRDRVVAMGQAATRYNFLANCLSESVTIYYLLGQQGIPSILRFGVRKRSGQIEAHAWLEHEGSVLNDRQDVASRFQPLAAGGAGEQTTIP